MKRYCQTLELYDDKELIEAYVAEHALAMTLALMGRIVEFHNDLAHGRWHGYWVKGGDSDQWESLRGKTCAILGTGSIGVELARLLAPFSCRVVGWRRDPSRGAPPWSARTGP